MPAKKNKSYTAEFKAKVALDPPKYKTMEWV